ncbi:MAG TPA: helix-turn-helix transcriptional regulator [Lacunisphaera sp.]|jgi:DNA-binding PadR family transcriptional regulator
MSDKTILNYGLWEMAVLSLLREQALHPYEIQRLLKARRKDDVLVLKRGSLYHAIKRLADAGLIEATETSREGRRPERTTYAITLAGRAVLPQWLKNLIAVPVRERSNFMGAMSFLFHLTPSDAIAALKSRISLLENELASNEVRLTEALPRIGRIHLVELEYSQAMQSAELAWVKALLSDLETTRLKWDWAKIIKAARTPVAKTLKRKTK